MRSRLILASVLAIGAAMLGPVRADPPSGDIVFENNVGMKSRDGVTLRTDIFHPKGPGPFPVIILRTPYNKYTNINEGFKGAARGYVFIIQDCRGREGSEGEWYPFKYEANDGYDAVEWAAALPYSNGKVGLFGGSYPGATQMLAATASPPHLVAIFPEITGSNYYAHWAYQGGAFMQGLAQAWCSALSLNEATRKISGSAQITHWDLMAPPADYPLLEPGLAKDLAPYYRDWIAHPTYDFYWKQWAIEEQFEKIKVPGYHLAAWYDIFQDGGIRNYQGIKKHGGTVQARQNQRLIIIPGGHAGWGTKIGEIEFGPKAQFSDWDLALRWFDWQLRGVDDGISKEKPVKIFVMGENVFRDEDEWPLARAVSTRYHLRSAGRANGLAGDGALSLEVPGAEPADRFVSDPDKPVPTHGGATLGIPFAPPGPFDQREVEARPDVLVYTTPAFDRPVEVTGPISLELFVSSSAVDTDLVGKLVDVYPDGRAINLSEGILRLRYRNSYEKPELLNPGQVYKVFVDLWSTANVFLPGHRLRVEVSGSSFPRFSRNLNIGGSSESAHQGIKATNVIYHDHEHPSALIVPVVPR
jgi:putative CocE/NonD family hydrolase